MSDHSEIPTDHPLYPQVHEVFLDYMNDLEAAEIAATAVIDGSDPHWRLALLENLLGASFAPDDADKIWSEGVAHLKNLESSLGRNPGLEVALFDYCRNISSITTSLQLTSTDTLASTGRDGLSGLSSLRFFNSRLHAESARSMRYSNPFVIALVDVDGYANLIADRSPEAGNSVIQRLGAIVNEATRQTDVASRISRQQIVLLLPETEKHGAFIQLERIRTRAEIDLKEFQTTISCGMAGCPADAKHPSELLEFAKQSLETARKMGNNRVCMDPEDRRSFPRLNESLLVRITPLDESSVAGEAITQDISGGGFCFEHASNYPCGSPIKGEIELPHIIVTFLGQVVRSEEVTSGRFNIGVNFTAIDPESRYQLLAFTR